MRFGGRLDAVFSITTPAPQSRPRGVTRFILLVAAIVLCAVAGWLIFQLTHRSTGGPSAASLAHRHLPTQRHVQRSTANGVPVPCTISSANPWKLDVYTAGSHEDVGSAEDQKIRRWAIQQACAWEAQHGRISTPVAGAGGVPNHTAHTGSVIRDSTIAPPWVTSAGLLSLYLHGYLKIPYTTHRRLTIRGLLSEIPANTFDGQHTIISLNGYIDSRFSRINEAGYVRALVPRGELPVSPLQAEALLVIQCQDISPDGLSLLLSSCRILDPQRKLGRNIEKDLMLESIRR